LESKFEPIEALAEEFLGRYRQGERPSLTEYVNEHPELAELIREYFPAMLVMEELGSVDGDTQSARLGGANIPDQIADYRILREMGRGGMGIVYEAIQESLGRRVALKVLPFHGLLGRTHLERFCREARAAARLHHTNIVPVFAVGEDHGIHYYAMQFIQGQSLAEVLREVRRQEPRFDDKTGLLDSSGSVPPSQSELTTQVQGPYFRKAAQIGLQVAEALDYAHREGILHRDIKPANLLLDTSGRMWITDFGLAKSEEWAELTSPGDVLGTVRYMAPERFQGRADARSDVYGLGLTLYEMLTLRPAFGDSDRVRLMDRIAHEEPPRPRQVDPHIPRDLETMVLKAMAKEPSLRYATSADLAADLRRYLDDRPIQARRTPLRERAWRWCKRNRLAAALMAFVVLLFALFSAGAFLYSAQLARALGDAKAANLVAQEKLWVSLADRAQALRMSRHPGQRVASLESIRDALKLPVPHGHSRAELRTAAIAALALPDLELMREWEGYPAGSRDLAFDGNLERYARLSSSGFVSVRRVSDDAEIAHWQESTKTWPDQESFLRFSPDGRYLCTRHAASGRLTVRKLDGPEPPICYEGANPAAGYAMDFSPDSQRLAYLVADSRVAIVDLASGRVTYLPATGDNQEYIRFAPDGRRFAVAVRRVNQRGIEIRDAATGRAQQLLPHAQHPVNPAWHPDGETLATCCDDKLIRIWHVASGRLLGVLAGHKTLGIHCAFTQDGSALLSNDWSNVLRVWEPSSGRLLLSRPANGYWMLHATSDGRVAAVHDSDLTRVQILHVHTALEYRAIGPGGYLSQGVSDLYRVAVHPKSRLLAARGARGSLLLVDLETGREVGSMSVDPHTTPLSWSGDLLTYGVRGLWRWPTHEEPQSPAYYRLGPPKRLLAGSFWDGPWGSSFDGQTIAIPDRNGGAGVFDQRSPAFASLRPLFPLSSEGRSPPPQGGSDFVHLRTQQDVRFCTVSPDGRWVATGSHNNNSASAVKVWSAASGELVKDLPVPTRSAADFSPDGRWLLTTGGGCRLWEVGSWRAGPKLGGAWGCFSADGALLALEHSAGALRLVRPDTGAELARLEAPEQTRLQPTAFSPDGRWLIAVGIDTEALHVWDLDLLRAQLADLGLDWDTSSYKTRAAPLAGNERPISLAAISMEISGIVPANCLEAEALKILDHAQCETQVQPMDRWDRRQWSDGSQLFCYCRQGGSVRLEVDVPQAGKYGVDAHFTMANDYGVLEVSIDGKRIGDRFDGFCAGVLPSGSISFGALELSRGKHQIGFTVVDKNPASDGYHMGIDCLELKLVED
jgi:serine/threonine protein kinase/WD40 repeat protein